VVPGLLDRLAAHFPELEHRLRGLPAADPEARLGEILTASLNTRPLASPHYRLFFAVGFLGAYTTFSTFSYETLRLAQDQSLVAALLNITGSVILGLVGVSFGVFFGGLCVK